MGCPDIGELRLGEFNLDHIDDRIQSRQAVLKLLAVRFRIVGDRQYNCPAVVPADPQASLGFLTLLPISEDNGHYVIIGV